MSRKIVLVFLAIIAFSSYSAGQKLNQELYKYSRVLRLVDGFYVDTVNLPSLVETSIVELLKELDPHSVYYSKEEVKALNEPLEGNFEGVGIQFNILDDTLIVVSPVVGGPSEKVGIRAGDRIVSIDEENVAGIGLTNKGVRDRLLGEKGSKVELKIRRKGISETLNFTVERDKIPIYSIDAAYKVQNDLGYIKLSRFARTSMDEFQDAVKKLKKEKVKDLILDLRGNGGGYLDIAFKLADEFLNEDKLIVYTKGVSSPQQDYFAGKKGSFEDGKIIVLIDEGSASASEIVSGAIQDWDRGMIIGRRSFGKGLVQRPFELPDGSLIRLTIARYYTPSGRLIQKPYEDGSEAYAEELAKRYEHGELMHADSIEFPDSLKFKTLVEKRTVYGGGGIMPDVFVGADTTGYSVYYSKLVRGGALYQYVVKYIDENRDGLHKKYSSFESFNKKFKVDQKILDGLIAYGEKEKIEFVEEDFETSKEDMSLQIKALIARDLWDTSEYYEVMNKDDKVFNKAVEVMNDWKAYRLSVMKE